MSKVPEDNVGMTDSTSAPGSAFQRFRTFQSVVFRYFLNLSGVFLNEPTLLSSACLYPVLTLPSFHRHVFYSINETEADVQLFFHETFT